MWMFSNRVNWLLFSILIMIWFFCAIKWLEFWAYIGSRKLGLCCRSNRSFELRMEVRDLCDIGNLLMHFWKKSKFLAILLFLVQCSWYAGVQTYIILHILIWCTRKSKKKKVVRESIGVFWEVGVVFVLQSNQLIILSRDRMMHKFQ